MLKRNRTKKTGGFPIVLGVVWAIMAFVFIRDIAVVVNGPERHYYDAKDIIEYYAKGNYSLGHSDVRSLKNRGISDQIYTEYQEAYAISEYMEAAAMYKMYMENGEAQKAAFYEERMESLVKLAHPLEYMTKEIDELLHLTE